MGTAGILAKWRGTSLSFGIAMILTLVVSTARATPSAFETLKEREQFGKFVELVDRVGLRPVLEGDTTLTLLAPVDAAFEKLSDVDRAWMNDPAQRARLRRLVASHIIWDALPTADIGHIHLRPSAAGRAVAFRRLPVAPVDGELIAPADAPAETVLHAGAARVVDADIITRNGLLHVVDAFVMIETIRTAPDHEPATTHAPSCDSNTSAHDEHVRMAMLERHRRAQKAAAGDGRGSSGGSSATGSSSGKPGSTDAASGDLGDAIPIPPTTSNNGPMPRGPGWGNGGCGCGMP